MQYSDDCRTSHRKATSFSLNLPFLQNLSTKNIQFMCWKQQIVKVKRMSRNNSPYDKY